jgi:hypothetical protein
MAIRPFLADLFLGSLLTIPTIYQLCYSNSPCRFTNAGFVRRLSLVMIQAGIRTPFNKSQTIPG